MGIGSLFDRSCVCCVVTLEIHRHTPHQPPTLPTTPLPQYLVTTTGTWWASSSRPTSPSAPSRRAPSSARSGASVRYSTLCESSDASVGGRPSAVRSSPDGPTDPPTIHRGTAQTGWRTGWRSPSSTSSTSSPTSSPTGPCVRASVRLSVRQSVCLPVHTPPRFDC